MLQGFFQIALTLLIVVGITPVLGTYLAQIFLAKKTFLDPIATPVDQLIYRTGGIDPEENMTGQQYAIAVLISNSAIAVFVFLLLILQQWLPLNPTKLGMPTWDTALHTSISFLVSADLQHYTPEITLSYFSQIAALGFLMFIGPATGLAVGIAFIRGLTGRNLGNFYVDLTRSITRVLLPLTILAALLLMAAGVPETLAGPATATTLEGATQVISRGPVAHFEAIKMLGENGGAFFGGNSAHPFENPNGASNLWQILSMLIIPASVIYTYGLFLGNRKQAWLLYGMVFAIFVALIVVTAVGEYQGNPLVNAAIGPQQNLEGKEVRLGWAQTALFAITTTGTMTGSANGMFDSLMPAGGFCALLNLFIQIIWGAMGTGTALLFVYLFLAVFLSGLLVGRTPEFFGRKIEQWDITLVSLILLIHPVLILIPAAITLTFPDTLSGISNPGFHGLTQVVYEYASAAAGNGSGFEGLADSQPAPTALWWNLTTSFTLWAGRFIPITALLFLADSMSRKQTVPETTATLRTDTLLFTGVTAATILILGVLTFLPVLALGPVAEAFQLANGR